MAPKKDKGPPEVMVINGKECRRVKDAATGKFVYRPVQVRLLVAYSDPTLAVALLGPGCVASAVRAPVSSVVLVVVARALQPLHLGAPCSSIGGVSWDLGRFG